MISPELKNFLQNKENQLLINENTKESWEEIYEKLAEGLSGEFTQIILNAGINDPAEIMRHISDYYLYGQEISSYKVPNGVTSIGNFAFSKCNNLTNITIPDSVTYIGNYAFRYCSNLTNVVIPDSVTVIGVAAFDYCTSLTSVVIPDSVTSIGDYAFSGCSSLTSVEIGDSVATIGLSAFSDCNGLTEIIFRGTKNKAIHCGVEKKRWRAQSSIQKIICTDGVIEL